MKIRLFLLALAGGCWMSAPAETGAEDSRTDDALTVWFDRPTTLAGRAVWNRPFDGMNNPDAEWETQSLPIGNGSIGANVMGSVAVERLTFNEKTLWLGGPNTAKGAAYYWDVNRPSARALPDIRAAFARGDRQEAARLTSQHFCGTAAYNPGDEQPFRFGHYTTMGEFCIDTGLSEEGMSGYRRALSLDSAVATVQFVHNGTAYCRRFFVSYPDNVLVMKFTADRPGSQHLAFRYTPNPLSAGTMTACGTDGLAYRAALNNNGMRYVVRIRAAAKGGRLTNDDGVLTVQGADEVVFYVTADTDYRMNFVPDFQDSHAYVGTDPDETTARWMKRAAARGYAALLRRHVADHAALFSRVRLRLNPSLPSTERPTPRRLADYRAGAADSRLEELYFQYGRYLLIACSRAGNLPANLQGLWHNNTDGPWRVDYHNNINLQMNYWPACSANLHECVQPLVDFIRLLEKPGRRTATACFGARGWTASISANVFGFTAPLNSPDMGWNFIPMAGPWLATHLWEYYDYTRDRNFLRETAYELISSSADFAVDCLWRKPDGTYTAAPSTSPEHGPVDEGATFAHAVVREILTDAIKASRVLRTDEERRAQWQQVLDSLAPYRIGRYGQLMEWAEDIDDPADKHRHVNHLFGLHPGHTVSPVSTPELARAARVVLEHRGDGATGWSMGWKLNLWARLHDGNHAYTLYRNLLKNGTADNLWDMHPPFQIDGNFGGTAGVAEMLLQNHDGCILLLPALPDAWAEGCVSGLCAKGNFEVDMTWKEGQLCEAVLRAGSDGECRVAYRGHALSWKARRGRTYRLRYGEETGLRRI